MSPSAGRDPGVYSRPGAASVRPSAMWDAIYELALGNVTGITPEGAQSLIDTSIANHEAEPDPHPVYVTLGEGDARWGASSGLSPHTHLDAATGGVIDYLRTQWGTDHLAAANPHPVYLTAAAAAATYLPLTGGGVTGPITYTMATAGTRQMEAWVTGEAGFRFYVNAQGALGWGPGTGSTDTTMARGVNPGELRFGATVMPTTNNLRDLGTTTIRWRKLYGVDAEFTNVPTVNGVSLDTRYAPAGSYLTQAAADPLYVNVGGDAMTSTLTIASTTVTPGLTTDHISATGQLRLTVGGGLIYPGAPNVVGLGSNGARWNGIWGQSGDFATGLTVAAKAVALSPNAGNTFQWLANGFFSDSPSKATIDALTSRVATLEAQVATLNGQMGSGANGHYHNMGTWRQTAKATLPATVLEEAPAA